MYTLLKQLFIRIFFSSSATNTKFSRLCVLGRFSYFSLIGLIGKTNSEMQFARPPLPKKSLWHGVNFLISALQYIIVLRETYKVLIRRYYCFDTVSTNICPMCSSYLYVNQRTKLKCIKTFVEMVIHWKIIHNDPVLWPLFFWLDAGTIAPKIPKWPMLFLKI